MWTPLILHDAIFFLLLLSRKKIVIFKCSKRKVGGCLGSQEDCGVFQLNKMTFTIKYEGAGTGDTNIFVTL